MSQTRCGWGAGVIYLAERLRKSQIVGFSNSKAQKMHIENLAKEKGLTNIEIITGNMTYYEFEPESFDRVLTVEVSTPFFEIPRADVYSLAAISRCLNT